MVGSFQASQSNDEAKIRIQQEVTKVVVEHVFFQIAWMMQALNSAFELYGRSKNIRAKTSDV